MSAIDYVQGPVSIEHWLVTGPNGLHKEIFMFGDLHVPISTLTQQCAPDTPNIVSVPDIFKVIVQSNPHITVDFFIEDFRGSEEFTRDDVYLSATRKAFQPCLNKDACHKLYPNLRYHYIDIRHFSADRPITIDMKNIVHVASGNYSDEHIDPLFAYIGTLHSGLGVLQERIQKAFKIAKQLDAIPNESVAELLYAHMVNHLTVFNNLFTNHYVAQQAFFPFLPIAQKRTVLTGLAAILLSKFAAYMDTYTMARMFRTFGAYESRYIMLYVGDMHRLSMSEMLGQLNALGNDITAKCLHTTIPSTLESVYTLAINLGNPTSTPTCLDVRGMNLPYFETAPPS